MYCLARGLDFAGEARRWTGERMERQYGRGNLCDTRAPQRVRGVLQGRWPRNLKRDEIRELRRKKEEMVPGTEPDSGGRWKFLKKEIYLPRGCQRVERTCCRRIRV